jgi:hypothetical protein
MKKTGKRRISEEDWNRHIDAILKQNLWRHEKQPNTQEEFDK